jgi:hypothetical protein
MSNSFGPLSREQFQALVNAPHGTASKEIRRRDPLWGRAPGEKIEFAVEFRANITDGIAYVKASSQDEANELARLLSFSDIDWDNGSFEVVTVTPREETP